ncbi:MAG: hypothetical protein RIS47_2108 [Bacteroidota bacterium]
MGFENYIGGYLVVNGAEAALAVLLRLEDVQWQEWPPFPRQAFAFSAESDAMYKGKCLIHFGLCVKDLHDWLDVWVAKFELFVYGIEACEEAFVVASVTVFRSYDFAGKFYYVWRKNLDGTWATESTKGNGLNSSVN